MIKKFTLLFNTVKYLRWQQIWFRLYYKFYSTPNIKLHPVKQRFWKICWESPSYQPQSIFNENEVVFLKQPGKIDQSSVWNDKEKSKLWLYNLHYFDDFNATDASDRILLHSYLINLWIKDNPPLYGVGWEPYTLSLRIVNYVKWFSKNHTLLNAEWLNSLALQAEALLKKLEYHILANHLFSNAKALVFAGSYFEKQRADYWLNKGLQIIDKQIKEQFLGDGAHFERSPMYHAIMLWDMCDLVKLADITEIPALKIRRSSWVYCINQGIFWLSAMVHPDGNIPFFNDTTFGIAPTLKQIREYANTLNIISDNNKVQKNLSYQLLQDSGYCAIHIDSGNKALIDIGKIGPDYQPGHAHAGILSFELSLYYQRVLVNSGISLYQGRATRQAQRSTRAHNTVTINEENSSEIWGDFRVARRAKPRDLLITNDSANGLIINCSHDGYLRLKNNNIHNREWIFKHNSISITDTVTGAYQSAIARYYLHPDIKVSRIDDVTIGLEYSDNKKAFFIVQFSDSIEMESSFWHPGFGVSIPNICIAIAFKSDKLKTIIKW